jgi:hypothetical protein
LEDAWVGLPGYGQFAGGKAPQYVRVQDVFLRKNTCCQRIGIIAGKHWHGGLGKDRTMIELCCHNMDGCPVNLHSGRNRPLMGVESRK